VEKLIQETSSSYKKYILALCGLVLLSRFVFGTTSLSIGNAADLFISSERIDLPNNIPHSPGAVYWALLIRAFTLLGLPGDIVQLTLSALGAAIAVYLFYKLLSIIADEEIGLWGAILLSSNILFWYHSATASNSSIAILYSIAVVYCLLSSQKWKRDVGALIYGFGAGINIVWMLLLLPVFARVIGVEKSKRRTLALAGLASIGIIGWLIELWFFQKGQSLTDYLFSGIDLSLQQNPLFFGLFALIAFNLLIPFLFKESRVALEPPFNNYFRWWFIPLFVFDLFISATPDSILLFIPPFTILTLLRIAPMEKAKYVVGAIASFNLLLFLFLPYIKPSTETYLSKTLRKDTPFVNTLATFVSKELPSRAHLSALSSAKKEALKLMSGIKTSDSALVLLDPLVHDLVHEQTLRSEFSSLTFGWYSGMKFNRLYLADGSSIPFIKSAQSASKVFYLGDKELVKYFFDHSLDSAVLKGESENFVLYEVPIDQRNPLLDKFLYLFNQSRHP